MEDMSQDMIIKAASTNGDRMTTATHSVVNKLCPYEARKLKGVKCVLQIDPTYVTVVTLKPGNHSCLPRNGPDLRLHRASPTAAYRREPDPLPRRRVSQHGYYLHEWHGRRMPVDSESPVFGCHGEWMLLMLGPLPLRASTRQRASPSRNLYQCNNGRGGASAIAARSGAEDLHFRRALASEPLRRSAELRSNTHPPAGR